MEMKKQLGQLRVFLTKLRERLENDDKHQDLTVDLDEKIKLVDIIIDRVDNKNQQTFVAQKLQLLLAYIEIILKLLG